MFRRLALTLTLASLPAVSSAANLSFTSATDFATAAGSTVLESFEASAPGVRAVAPIVTPLLTVSSPSTPMGVQSAANVPSDGFGSFATDGTQYLSVYRANQPVGTLTFSLAGPATAFGFDLTDIEVLGGHISLSTDVGAFAGGITLETVGSNANNGSLRFFGITQDQAFSTVFLTIDGLDDAAGIDNIRVAAVPLPAPAWLLGAGLVALATRGRRQRG
ncbi:MAG: VPLPA-CTERM sorting domain-containing protein [Proteobacteria bacterium]|nr:VPLPA-CTERM sorting domain-containing protein [Pseudomonadota bacterium]